MQPCAQNRAVKFSQKLYARLLAAYPARHRQEYGGAMAQLFRDQCRDAWNERRALGLAALWLRTVPDLLKTSFIERFSTLNPRKFMSDKLTGLLRPRKSPLFTFTVVFTVVFLMVFSAAVVITFILPESYASTARMEVGAVPDYSTATGRATESTPSYDPFFVQTMMEIVQSQAVLSNVVSKLNLNVAWGKRYYGGKPIETAEAIELLRRRLSLQPVSNTKLISITAYSEDKNEAAQVANALAESFQDYQLRTRKANDAESLAAQRELYRRQAAQIEQLQADKAALAQKFGIDENFEVSDGKYQEQMMEGGRVYKQLQTQLDKLKALDTVKLRDVLPTVTGDSSLSDLLGKYHTCAQTYASLTNDYAAADLHVMRVKSMMEELNGEIDARVVGIMAGLESEVASKRAALDELRSSVGSQIEKSKPTPANQPYWDKKHDLEQLQDFHKVVAGNIDYLQLDLEIPRTSFAITDSATPGNVPVKPNKPLNIAIGAVAGVFLGAVCGAIAAFITARRGKRPTAPVPAPAA